MKRVLKFLIGSNVMLHIPMHWEDRIVLAGQALDGHGHLATFLWAEVRDEGDPNVRTRTFHVYGTGQDIPPTYQHRTSFIETLENGSVYVWHIYEEAR